MMVIAHEISRSIDSQSETSFLTAMNSSLFLLNGLDIPHTVDKAKTTLPWLVSPVVPTGNQLHGLLENPPNIEQSCSNSSGISQPWQ